MFETIKKYFIPTKKDPIPKLGIKSNSYFSTGHIKEDNFIKFKKQDETAKIREITGIKSDIPKNGNILRSPTKDKIILWEIFNVTKDTKNNNQFSAKVKFIGYSLNGYTLLE